LQLAKRALLHRFCQRAANLDDAEARRLREPAGCHGRAKWIFHGAQVPDDANIEMIGNGRTAWFFCTPE